MSQRHRTAQASEAMIFCTRAAVRYPFQYVASAVGHVILARVCLADIFVFCVPVRWHTALTQLPAIAFRDKR